MLTRIDESWRSKMSVSRKYHASIFDRTFPRNIMKSCFLGEYIYFSSCFKNNHDVAAKQFRASERKVRDDDNFLKKSGQICFYTYIALNLLLLCFRSAMRTLAMLTLAMLVPILGTTWVFGIVAFANDSVIFQYIFAVCNAFQVTYTFNAA